MHNYIYAILYIALFQPYTKKTDFELVPGLIISKTIEICGFISVGDVGSPSSISRHLVLPLATEKTSNMQGISLEEDSDTDENGDEGKPSFCVLLHGALKVISSDLLIIFLMHLN
jgi:hypothetical protein